MQRNEGIKPKELFPEAKTNKANKSRFENSLCSQASYPYLMQKLQ